MTSTTQKSDYLTVDHLNRKALKRIFKRIAVNPRTRCWEWLGYTVGGGYPRTTHQGHKELTHRVLYAWAVGPVPRQQKGSNTLNLDHVVCNNPSCCNPAHVELVPARSNTLRGNGPTAINARKTHCIRGHLLPTVSTRRNRNERVCNECRRLRYSLGLST